MTEKKPHSPAIEPLIEGSILAIQDVLKRAQAQWQDEIKLIRAEARATIAELRRDVAETKAELAIIAARRDEVS